MMFLDCIGEHLFRLVDLTADLRKIGQLHRGALFVDERFQIETIKFKVIVLYFESFLGEVEGLRHQVGVRIVH